jgi:hypothetical protein
MIIIIIIIMVQRDFQAYFPHLPDLYLIGITGLHVYFKTIGTAMATFSWWEKVALHLGMYCKIVRDFKNKRFSNDCLLCQGALHFANFD